MFSRNGVSRVEFELSWLRLDRTTDPPPGHVLGLCFETFWFQRADNSSLRLCDEPAEACSLVAPAQNEDCCPFPRSPFPGLPHPQTTLLLDFHAINTLSPWPSGRQTQGLFSYFLAWLFLLQTSVSQRFTLCNKQNKPVSIFWLLWIMPLWTLVYQHLFEFLLSILLDIPRSGSEGNSMFVCFWGTAILISTAATPFCISTISPFWVNFCIQCEVGVPFFCMW